MVVSIERHSKPRRIQLNISGERYETYLKTLERFPQTLLGDMTKRRRYFYKGEYFFNRNRTVFDSILFFYQSFGRLRRPSNVPMSIFEKECRYFHLPDEAISSMKEKEGYVTGWKEIKPPETTREKIWHTLEFPESSRIALIYAIISLTITLMSVILAFAETMPSVRLTPSNRRFMFAIDLFATVWFAIEITVYGFTAPHKKTMKRPMFYIDFLSSYPYLIIFLVPQTKALLIIKFCRMLRLIRLLRLFKIFTSSKRTEMLTRILVSSLPELFLLFLCLMIIICLGATLMYMIESGEPESKFDSIPACSWWALQTVVVLGYGDMVPTTGGGKLLASVFMICGATTIALPVLSVATKFLNIYEANADYIHDEIHGVNTE